jgi:integrase/recombinase XerD
MTLPLSISILFTPWEGAVIDGELTHAIRDYLQWMVSEGYAPRTCESYGYELNHFLSFVNDKDIRWDDIFTLDTLKSFQDSRGLRNGYAIRGLSRYLFSQKRIRRPIKKTHHRLPQIYEQYLLYYEQRQEVAFRRVKQTRQVLAAFNHYLQRHRIDLSLLSIQHLDAFTREYFEPFSTATCRAYRSALRGFLRYLHGERKIIHRDLADLITGRRSYAQPKPPKFLRPQEVQKLFACLRLSTPVDIRTYAMIHLAYSLGLRPLEISKITLDDISFSKQEITLRDRKGDNPITLPIPEHTARAIAAYIIRVRPESKHRTLFLSLQTPHGPITPNVVSLYISQCMKQANLPSTPYWLRHTYGQNLLESGTSVFEIKDMMGHDKIESTRNYLHIHMKLMRKVLFNETL